MQFERHEAPVIESGGRETEAAGATAGGNLHVSAHYLSGIPICQPRRRGAYLPLLFSFGAVDDGEPVLDDEDDDGVELDDAFVSDEAGGVLDDELLDGVDGAAGLIDELDDDEPLGVAGVDGVLDDDDDDGDGVTVGGAVLLVDVSRLQPARPSASPVQSNVTNAIFISILRERLG